ncbi:hypothetical protein HAX54_013821, partial [Datura stramonium]|nr:hypothetical protein [Datura stramonium]
LVVSESVLKSYKNILSLYSSQWKIEGMREIYATRLEITTRGNVKRCMFEEVEIRFSNLNEFPNMKELFDHYCLGWMRRKGISKKSNPPLDKVQVKGRMVDISERTI